jgi:REP element-mobilizing transposase RayT
MPDHVHMLISIPPKYSVAVVIGYLKGSERHDGTTCHFRG